MIREHPGGDSAGGCGSSGEFWLLSPSGGSISWRWTSPRNVPFRRSRIPYGASRA